MVETDRLTDHRVLLGIPTVSSPTGKKTAGNVTLQHLLLTDYNLVLACSNSMRLGRCV